jgi:hypothetical protein
MGHPQRIVELEAVDPERQPSYLPAIILVSVVLVIGFILGVLTTAALT